MARRPPLRRPAPGGSNEGPIESPALTYSEEWRARYRPRLVGFDREWSPEKTDVKIRYTNLPAYLFPKTYRFAVIARNSDGVWSKPLTFDMKILPALWLRWWAFLAYVGVIWLVGYTASRWRQRQFRPRQREPEG